MEFTKEFLLRPFGSVFGIFTGAVGMLSWTFFPADAALWLKIWFVTALVFFVLFVHASFKAHSYFYRAAIAPVTVRAICRGEYYYSGSYLVILDKVGWATYGSLLTLSMIRDHVLVPIAILRVDTFTDKGFAQCVILKFLGEQDRTDSLVESEKWKSLSAAPIIMQSHLEG